MQAQLDTPWQVMFKCREQRSALHADGLKQGLTERVNLVRAVLTLKVTVMTWMSVCAVAVFV